MGSFRRLGFRVQGVRLGFRVQGLGLGLQGVSGFRASGLAV